MKKLNLGFRSATKNTMHHLQLNYVKTELEAETVEEVHGADRSVRNLQRQER